MPLTEDDRPVGSPESWQGAWETGASALPRHGAAGKGSMEMYQCKPPTTVLAPLFAHSPNPHQTWGAGNGTWEVGGGGVQSSSLASRKQGWPSPGLGAGAGRCALGLRSRTELGLPTPYVQRYVVSLEAQDIWKALGNDAGPACWPAWLAGGVGAAPRVSTPLLVAGWVHGVRT